MPAKPRGLGRGFEALIPTDLVETEFDPTAQAGGGKRAGGESIVQAPVGQVDPNPHQPRQDFKPAALESLASSIKLHGILQPLVATKSGSRYELIAGERRLRAAKLAGLDTVPLIVRSFDEQQKLELALIENLQREDLNPMETATAYKKLQDQFNLTLEQIGRKVGHDYSTVSNSIRLLGLPIEAKRAIMAGQISEGHGRVILSVREPAKQAEMLELIMKNGWNVRQAEEFARAFKRKEGTPEHGFKRIAATNEVTEALAKRFDTKVILYPTARGGQLRISYYNDDHLARIIKAIEGN